MLFPVISGNAPQMTETTWQRTSKYESSVQSPPQTTIWHLATHLKLQNAPQTTLPTALPTCSWNKDPGRECWESGSPKKQKKTLKVDKQPETSRTINQSWIWTNHDFKCQNTKVWSGKEGRHIQNMITPSRKDWTAHQDFWKPDSQERNKGERKYKIIWNEQFTAEMVVLKFQPQLAHKSDIKTTTMKTCICNKFKGFVFEHYQQHSLHVTFHTCMPPCPSFQGCSLSDGHWDGTTFGDAHNLISTLVLSPLDVKQRTFLFSWGTQCLLSNHHYSPHSPSLEKHLSKGVRAISSWRKTDSSSFLVWGGFVFCRAL